MAGGKGVDLLMKFQIAGDEYVRAESTSKISLKTVEQDPMLAGYKEGKIFEVFDFSFGTGVQLGAADEKEAELTEDLNAAKTAKNKAEIKRLEAKLAKRKQARGREWTFGDDFPVDMQPVTFSRFIDKASSTLLERCINSEYFDTVTIVKRRSVGGEYSGYGYMRIDFGGVMLTQINWSDDDQVKETVTFVCRSVLVQYRPVLPNGELGAPKSGNWEAPGVDPLPVPTS